MTSPDPTMSLASAIAGKPARIDILLPSKERFGPANAGAISGVVKDLIEASTTPDLFHVFGSPVDETFDGIAFTPVKPYRKWLHGGNIGLAEGYLQQITETGGPDLVEVHSRCQVAAHIKSRRPELRVALYLHNDPRDMKGARSIADRMSLLHSQSAIFCVSDYIRHCFLDGLNAPNDLADKVHTVRNGAYRWLDSKPEKENFILMAGRMVPEKGILECATAIASTLQNHPDWKVIIAGAKSFEAAQPSSYEAAVAKALVPLGARAQMTGFIPITEVRNLQARAAIITCPSIWHDPMPKAVLEALAAGSALLTTNRGGIPEVAAGRAHIVDPPTVDSFAAGLEQLISDGAYRARLQDQAWTDFPFTAQQMAMDADTARCVALLQPL